MEPVFLTPLVLRQRWAVEYVEASVMAWHCMVILPWAALASWWEVSWLGKRLVSIAVGGDQVFGM